MFFSSRCSKLCASIVITVLRCTSIVCAVALPYYSYCDVNHGSRHTDGNVDLSLTSHMRAGCLAYLNNNLLFIDGILIVFYHLYLLSIESFCTLSGRLRDGQQVFGV